MVKGCVSASYHLVLGMRIIVPFGKRKKYTAIAWRVHQVPPKTYAPKQIESIIDMEAVLQQLRVLWRL